MTQLLPHPTAPRLDTDRDVASLAADLVGPAIRRQLWLLMLDSDRRPLPMLIPIEDAPMTGPSAEAEQFAIGIAGICGGLGGASLVLVWERPGAASLAPDEAAWVGSLGRAIAEQGIPITAQALAHDHGVAVLHLD